MKKARLEVLTLVPSPAHNDLFTLLLGEIGGFRRLPIRLGPIEAQAIALAWEHGLLERPLTHDLFKEVLLQLDYILQEVAITDLKNEVFFAKMTLSNGLTPVTVDARPSDAIAMALRFGADLYIDETLLEKTHRKMAPPSNAETVIVDELLPLITKKSLKYYPLDTLNHILQHVVEEEAYEQAALLRDEIDRRSAPLVE